MSFFIFSIFFILPLLKAQSILPTKSQQINLLTSVKQLLEQIKTAMQKERMTAEQSTLLDFDIMLKNNIFTLNTLKELSLLKLPSNINSVCVKSAHDHIEELARQSTQNFEQCIKNAKENVTTNLINLTNTNDVTINNAEHFVEKLTNCSRHKGIAIITCYKKVIDMDVKPVETALHDGIEYHSELKLKFYEIKSTTNLCVNYQLDFIKTEFSKCVERALRCKKVVEVAKLK